jgi:hypothetical protein
MLQSIINKAKEMCILRLPIKVGYTTEFPIVQYADNTLLIMEACPLQLFALKAILNSFVSSTGLKINYVKSIMVPINVQPYRLQHLAETFNYQTTSLPFTYLCLPSGSSLPSSQDCWPLVTRLERRLISTSTFLSHGGKLQMVNSVLSSLPTYYMCSIKISIAILNQIDKYKRHCLWLGGDVNGKKPPLAAWKLFCRLKSKGGLGVIKLRLQNEVLLMKNLHNFFSRAELPWVKLIGTKYYANGKVPSHRKKGSFWWRRNLNLLDSFKGIANATFGTGDNILFWNGLWNGRILNLLFPLSIFFC